jgi:hypothetical protein
MDEAYRLTFELDGDRLALKAVRRVTMRVPRGESSDRAERVGRFVELRGGTGEPLYRRQVTDLASGTVEYPTGDPRRPFARTEAPGRLVTVLVPAHEAARSVALVEVAAPPQRSDRAMQREGYPAPRSRDLITVDLRGEGAA